MSNLIHALNLAAALGSGLIAGFFFSFSAVVMRALGRLPPEQGIAAMQRINVVVLNRWFFSAFFGTAVVCVVLTAWALLNLPATGAAHLLVASLLYLAGVIVVTIAFNVPLNNGARRPRQHRWRACLGAVPRGMDQVESRENGSAAGCCSAVRAGAALTALDPVERGYGRYCRPRVCRSW